MVARAYIRHPSDMPIELSPLPGSDSVSSQTRDISLGGLSFHSARALDKGAQVSLRIPVVTPAFEANARVIWCQATKDGYEVGIEFTDGEDAYRARMVEQICHIEHYRLWVKEIEGRELNTESAALEWIGKYAHEFPVLN